MKPQLKNFTQHTTQVAFSTGVVASLVQGGCVVVGRDDDATDNPGVDAGQDEVVEQLEMDTLETASHAYHRPPTGRDPIVMPLELEDAPSTPPPLRADSPRPNRRPSANRRRTPTPPLGAETVQADPVIAARPAEGIAAIAEPIEAHAEAAAEPKKASAPKRRRSSDPVGKSFVPIGRSTLHSNYGGY